MSLRIPSFRTQIVVLVSLVSLIAALFLREFFISNLTSYQDQVSELSTKQQVRQLYQRYSVFLDSTALTDFNHETEEILRDLNKTEIAGEFYSRDIRHYSFGIVMLMVMLTASVFLLLFIIITRPLSRLLAATETLKQGNFEIQVKESIYSPLNGLIVAFNSMVSELNASREHLLEAEKQTIWQEMARAMAHEIKNPLTPIRLASQRLEMKYHEQAENLPEILEKSLRIINEEVDNLQALVTAFSGFAKMPEAQFETYDLNQQISNIASQYSDEARIEMKLSAALENIYADPIQIKQVLVNLIQNAIQACSDTPHIELQSEVQKQHCLIRIIDHGRGIPEADLIKIFEPYYTKRKKGTGLGLAIVRRIIRQHGGDIGVRSIVGTGSTFEISLPCNPEVSQHLNDVPKD